MQRAVIIVSVVAVLGVGILVLSQSGSNTGHQRNAGKAAEAITLQDAHGLAVDRADESRVYIATHSGLIVLRNDATLERVGHAQDDYMGFTVHPSDPNTFYASGHPRAGGNLGFQKSTDGGTSWQKVSDGNNGPVDFHTMAVSQMDPSLLYGWYGGQLQRTTDEGKTWETLETGLKKVISLTTSPADKDTVFAATADGLHISTDQGSTWKRSGLNGTVTSPAVSSTAPQELTAYSMTDGLTRSSDGGTTWSKLSSYGSDFAVMHLAADPHNAGTMYLVNQELQIYKTTDNAASWKKVL